MAGDSVSKYKRLIVERVTVREVQEAQKIMISIHKLCQVTSYLVVKAKDDREKARSLRYEEIGSLGQSEERSSTEMDQAVGC